MEHNTRGTAREMPTLAEHVTLAPMHVVRRDWVTMTGRWREWFQVDLSDDLEAMTQFSLAVVAVLLGDDSPGRLRRAVHAAVRDRFPGHAREFVSALITYEAAWQDRSPVKPRYMVPPLQHSIEALAIVFLDSVNCRATMGIGGGEFYNLFHVGVVGGCMGSCAAEAKRLLDSVRDRG